MISAGMIPLINAEWKNLLGCISLLLGASVPVRRRRAEVCNGPKLERGARWTAGRWVQNGWDRFVWFHGKKDDGGPGKKNSRSPSDHHRLCKADLTPRATTVDTD